MIDSGRVARTVASTSGWLVGAAVGLAMTSAALAGDITPPKVNVVTPGGVSIADGSFNYSRTDLTIGTLTLERFFWANPNSPYDPDHMFYGPRVSNNFDIYVVPQFQRATPPYFPVHYRAVVHMGSGSSGSYYQSNFTTSASALNDNNDAAVQGQLGFVSGVYTYTDQSGTIYVFNPSVIASGTQGASGWSQRIDHITYPDGRVRQFSYVGSNLKMVADSTGYAIIFDWNAYGEIVDACGFDQAQTYVTTSTTCSGAMLKVSYTYAGSGNPYYPSGAGYLTGVTDVLSQTETYDYSSGICVKPPGYSVCKFTYNLYNIQTFADGSVWTNSNSVASPPPTDSDYVPPSDGDNPAGYVDANGKSWNWIFTGTAPYTLTDPLTFGTDGLFTGAHVYRVAVGEPPRIKQ